MGLMFGLLLVVMLAFSFLAYLTESTKRQKTHERFRSAPVRFIFERLAAVMAAGFFLGIFVRPLGRIPIRFGQVTYPLWAVCGVLAGLCSIVWFFSIRSIQLDLNDV